MPDGLTLVLGGARSGKSAHAEALVTARPGPWLYLATAEARDAEMAARIALHRARRAAGWETREVPLALPETLAALPAGRPALVDCLTLWLSNLMLAGGDPAAETDRLAAALARPRGPLVLVSNEVGLGIVPANPDARAYRDRLGAVNRVFADRAKTAALVVAGRLLRLEKTL